MEFGLNHACTWPELWSSQRREAANLPVISSIVRAGSSKHADVHVSHHPWQNTSTQPCYARRASTKQLNGPNAHWVIHRHRSKFCLRISEPLCIVSFDRCLKQGWELRPRYTTNCPSGTRFCVFKGARTVQFSKLLTTLCLKKRSKCILLNVDPCRTSFYLSICDLLHTVKKKTVIKG